MEEQQNVCPKCQKPADQCACNADQNAPAGDQQQAPEAPQAPQGN